MDDDVVVISDEEFSRNHKHYIQKSMDGFCIKITDSNGVIKSVMGIGKAELTDDQLRRIEEHERMIEVMSSFCMECSRKLKGPRIVVGAFCCLKCRIKTCLKLIKELKFKRAYLLFFKKEQF